MLKHKFQNISSWCRSKNWGFFSPPFFVFDAESEVEKYPSKVGIFPQSKSMLLIAHSSKISLELQFLEAIRRQIRIRISSILGLDLYKDEFKHIKVI